MGFVNITCSRCEPGQSVQCTVCQGRGSILVHTSQLSTGPTPPIVQKTDPYREVWEQLDLFEPMTEALSSMALDDTIFAVRWQTLVDGTVQVTEVIKEEANGG